MRNLKVSKKNKLLFFFAKFFFIFSLSLFFAFLVANSYEQPKINSDLKTYSLHYECLQDDFSSLAKCSEVIGSPIDVLYEYVAFFFKVLFGGSGFVFFILIFSFLVYFLIISITIELSNNYFLIALFFLLSDFRFYELGNNVLRNGLAVVLVLIIFRLYSYRSLNLGWVYRVIPSFAHITSLPFLFVIKLKLSLYLYAVFLAIAFLVGFKFSELLGFVYPILSVSLQGKISAYQILSQGEFQNWFNFPFHYLLIIILSSLFVKRVRNEIFLLAFNISYVFFVFSLIFNQFGIGYRFLNFIVPFLAIMLAYIFSYLRHIENSLIYFFAVFFYFVFLMIVFFKNYDFIIRGFI